MPQHDLHTRMSDFMKWDQQEAKAKFSEVIRRAWHEGPQLVTTRSAKPVVVMSGDDYLALTEQRPTSFYDLLLPGEGFELQRADSSALDRDLPL